MDRAGIAIRFRTFAMSEGIEGDDPLLAEAVEALRKLEKGEFGARETDLALGPVFKILNEKVDTRLSISGAIWGMPDESNSFRSWPLLEIADQLGIDKTDPLLVRALEAQQKAEKTNLQSWLEMGIAVRAFTHTYFEVTEAWPPASHHIERLLQKLAAGEATDVEAEEFRLLAGQVLVDWQPHYSPAFKTRIESALGSLGTRDSSSSPG
ncbi:MAG: hypothetical protein WBL50_03635 [Candidatus Acidiferrum sp.]